MDNSERVSRVGGKETNNPRPVLVFPRDGVLHWPKATQSQEVREPFDVAPKGQRG